MAAGSSGIAFINWKRLLNSAISLAQSYKGILPRPADWVKLVYRPQYQDHIVERYLKSGVPLLDANSGFEPETFDDRVFARWSPVLKGPWRFGYDEGSEGENVRRVMTMLRDVSPRRKQVYTMIGHEPFEVCMDRIRRVIEWGGEPYAQPFMKLNALAKTPAIRHDWTAQKLRHVQRWTNRHLYRKTPNFADYDASAKTERPQDGLDGTMFGSDA